MMQKKYYFHYDFSCKKSTTFITICKKVDCTKFVSKHEFLLAIPAISETSGVNCTQKLKPVAIQMICVFKTKQRFH
jgi:hypothetical protein